MKKDISKTKNEHSDPQLNKYLLMFKLAKDNSDRIAIINKIYEDGFEDGSNQTEVG